MRADFMQKQSAGLAREGEADCKAELLFRSGGSMFFVLPDEDVPLQTLLTERGLQELLTDEGAQNRDIAWSVPKFRQNGEMQLIDLLRSLGVTDAFDSDAANFSHGWNVPLEMRLDRPFLYGVRSADGTLLFVGVCADPTQED